MAVSYTLWLFVFVQLSIVQTSHQKPISDWLEPGDGVIEVSNATMSSENSSPTIFRKHMLERIHGILEHKSFLHNNEKSNSEQIHFQIRSPLTG